MLKLDFMQTVAAAGLVLALGGLIRRWVPFTRRYNLPTPVLGGITVATLLALMRRDGQLPIQFDTTLQSPLMIGFFTSLGFGASLRLLRTGGPQVITYLVACTVLAVLQNLVGAGLSVAMGLPALFGVLAGSVTLTGGPGTGLAFADAFQAAGVPAAASVAVTAAMGGIVLGGLVGAPVSTWLVERHRLHPAPRETARVDTAAAAPGLGLSSSLLRHLVVILVAMWGGGYVSAAISAAGVTLPPYIGAMLVAAVIRNLDDRSPFLKLDAELLDTLGSVALSLFLALALMTLKLWELAAVALPLLVLLLTQTVLMIAVAATVMFRLSGRDYDAAVMSGGLVGFMMGTTANAMAIMEAMTRRYGPAPRAFLVVPLVGACFIDFTNSVIITACLNVFGPGK